MCCKVQKNTAKREENISDYHKWAEFSEATVSLVYYVAYNRVCNAVKYTHDCKKQRNHYNRYSGDSVGIV